MTKNRLHHAVLLQEEKAQQLKLQEQRATAERLKVQQSTKQQDYFTQVALDSNILKNMDLVCEHLKDNTASTGA